jgi:hypothetical protein
MRNQDVIHLTKELLSEFPVIRYLNPVGTSMRNAQPQTSSYRSLRAAGGRISANTEANGQIWPPKSRLNRRGGSYTHRPRQLILLYSSAVLIKVVSETYDPPISAGGGR